MIVLVYVDDCILISRESSTIKKFIESLASGPEGFIFTDEGTMERYLGVEITKFDDGSGFSLTQSFLIERVLKTIGIDQNGTLGRKTPATKPNLSRNINGSPR
ncbi:MAG: hypothetical protein GY818_14395, partial [Planctomycetaceae bacterium]|nr:hypothetical protein [Planctomycetaceae bacterium]